MDKTVVAMTEVDCPHCDAEKLEITFNYYEDGQPVRVPCPACGENIWIRVLDVDARGQARIQIGKDIPADVLGKELNECGGQCPTCGTVFDKESLNKAYLITQDLTVVRQNKKLSRHGIAVMIERLCKSETFPALFVARENLKYGDIVIKLKWIDRQRMKEGLNMYSEVIPETDYDDEDREVESV